MTRADPGLHFWLDYVTHRGGLWEDTGASALVVLPEPLAAEFDLAEEMLVTSDPDVAREDGVSFLATGHPAILKAAEAVLARGDTGVRTLARPRSLPPSPDALLARAREQFPVDHGRIDLAAEAAEAAEPVPVARPATRPVARVAALVSYTVSAEDHFQERVECWVDVPSRLGLPERISNQLARGELAGGYLAGGDDRAGDLTGALAEAYRVIEAASLRRRQVLSAQGQGSHDLERERAEAYYAGVLASLERRRATAPPDRQALLDARAQSTREERARRLVEISEKYQARHEIRPYRLHLVHVPVLRMAVDVRRGERRYPLVLDWLLPVREFAGVRCPTCGEHAPLVATKSVLGCDRCQARKPAAPGRQAAHQKPAAQEPPAPKPAQKPAQKPARKPAPKPAPKPARSPVPPAARKPVKTARTDRADTDRAGERLALAFWEAAALGQRRALARLCAPDSPAAAALRIYGAAGPLYAVGIPAGQVPQSVTTATHLGGVFGLEACGGELDTGVSQYPYMLRWRAEGRARLVAEALPFSSPFAMRMLFSPRLRGMFGPSGSRTLTGLPEPREDLDQVALVLWTVALPRHGVSIVLRALAAWWRVPDGAALLARTPAPVLAAALDRAVCYWSGAEGGGYGDAAAAYQADEAAVRKANATLQRSLKLSRDQPW